jgi:predicted ATPase/class 3 adenylate cyclase
MRCVNCGADNRVGRKFCAECGTALAIACPACGTANQPGEKFCGECGTALTATDPVPVGRTEPVSAVPSAERRLVSVLFADLVGFTSLSEERDPEEVRDLLTRYFETSRRLIERYGGTVEKFIGDAVMAVWGTPIAREDDPERAVRAALELTEAVETLGAEAGLPKLRARAGVLTGEAAVTVGAEGQGMVAGDLVNTAARIQSVAPSGSVFVGEVTRRATEAAIVYEDAGPHALKGKAEPAALSRAVRVVAKVGGVARSSGLEAPFVGRDRELRMLKDLFHASAERSAAHLVSVAGVAGMGKSRLTWELYKYIDGLATNVRWHRGRCLAYGEGVTYWALAEMVRTRAGILEGEEAETALPKLRSAIEDSVPDPEERRWIEPRLAHLLGLEERTAGEREDLFAAWRLFYERLAEEMPTVMVFEDLHWADAALLDFIDYLMEWSRGHRLFVLTLARPDLLDRRPTWGAGRRNFTSISLEALPQEVMEAMLRDLVPGLPDDVRSGILERAQGVPLYAVETVRMLLDRGLLVQEGNEYRPTGSIASLDVPETLHALIAARLDGLTPEERRLVQDASVLGKTFARAAIAALSRVPDPELDAMLASLVRKEILSLLVDPLSPERGQYAFLQDLMKGVAYEMLSKRERKARHLAVASYFESLHGADEPEIAEVLAAHYSDAYRLVPEAEDAAETRDRAREALLRAGERAASLAATEEAERYFSEAAELAEDALQRAAALERAGVVAHTGGRAPEASRYFEQAIALFEAEGRTHPAARVSARLAQAMWERGAFAGSLELMDRSFRVIAEEEADEDVAELAGQLARHLYFAGRIDAAEERVEQALDVAEALFLPEVLSHALNTKALVRLAQGHRREGLALMRYALDIALEHDLAGAALRAYYNLADSVAHADRYHEALELVRSGLALARRVGNRNWELNLLGQMYPLLALGEWDDLLAHAAQMPEELAGDVRGAFLVFPALVAWVHLQRGDLGEARRNVELFPKPTGTEDLQERAEYGMGMAWLLLGEGRPADALRWAEESFAAAPTLGYSHEAVKESLVVAVEAALDLGDLHHVEELLGPVESLPRGRFPIYLEAHVSRFRARLAAASGVSDGVEGRFKSAAGRFREMAVPFWMAVTLLEHAEWLVGQGRGSEGQPLLAEAREIFERLKARPWVERLDPIAPMPRVGSGVAGA